MITIWKFPIEVTDIQTIEMPVKAQILTVQVQHNRPFLWAMVNSYYPIESRKIRIFGTGHDLSQEDASKYIGTFQVDGGNLVFHVFDQS